MARVKQSSIHVSSFAIAGKEENSENNGGRRACSSYHTHPFLGKQTNLNRKIEGSDSKKGTKRKGEKEIGTK